MAEEVIGTRRGQRKLDEREMLLTAPFESCRDRLSLVRFVIVSVRPSRIKQKSALKQAMAAFSQIVYDSLI